MKTQTDRKRHHILIALFIMAMSAALTFGVLMLFRSRNQRSYIAKINTAAQSFYHNVNAYMADHGESAADGIYSAEYHPDTAQLVLKNTVTDITLVMTDIPDLSGNGKRMYFLTEIKNGYCANVCACRSSSLKAADLDRHTNEHTTLTFAEYYLNRFVGHYP